MWQMMKLSWKQTRHLRTPWWMFPSVWFAILRFNRKVKTVANAGPIGGDAAGIFSPERGWHPDVERLMGEPNEGIFEKEAG